MCLIETISAGAFDDIFGIFHKEALRQAHQRYGIVFEAVGLATLRACEVNMVEVAVVFAAAHAIFLLPSTIIDSMQQVMVSEELQSTEDAGAVHVGQQTLHVGEREGLALLTGILPHQYAHCSGVDTMGGKVGFGGHKRALLRYAVISL